MTATLPENSTRQDQLRELAHELQTPEGVRVEIIGGTIVMSPSPVGRHNFIASQIEGQINVANPKGLSATHDLTLEFPATGEEFIPDVTVLPEEVLDSEEWLFSPDDVELVVEITSSDEGEHDWGKKLKGYATSGIPLYLIVDRTRSLCVLHSEPSAGRYRTVRETDFGAPVVLPAPLDLAVDTRRFPR